MNTTPGAEMQPFEHNKILKDYISFLAVHAPCLSVGEWSAFLQEINRLVSKEGKGMPEEISHNLKTNSMNQLNDKILAALTQQEEFTKDSVVVRCIEYGNISKAVVKLLYNESIGLLNEFWQSSSDACPLEESVMNEQLKEFEKFINKKYGII